MLRYRNRNNQSVIGWLKENRDDLKLNNSLYVNISAELLAVTAPQDKVIDLISSLPESLDAKELEVISKIENASDGEKISIKVIVADGKANIFLKGEKIELPKEEKKEKAVEKKTEEEKAAEEEKEKRKDEKKLAEKAAEKAAIKRGTE